MTSSLAPQVGIVTAIILAVGLPIGLLVGRWLWSLVTKPIGLLYGSSPLPAYVGITALLASAAAVSALIAARSSPSHVDRRHPPRTVSALGDVSGGRGRGDGVASVPRQPVASGSRASTASRARRRSSTRSSTVSIPTEQPHEAGIDRERRVGRGERGSSGPGAR